MASPAPVNAALRSPGPGEPLPAQVARPLRRSLGIDVSPVRVHRDPGATAAADALSTRAFAYGNRVFLGSGQRPTDVGLMAHEVAHVVQQQAGPALQLFSTSGGEAYEREARSVSAAVVAGRPARVGGRTGGARIQGEGGVLGFVKRGLSAVGNLAADAFAAAKSAALGFIREHASKIPGYGLLTQALERDPVTEQPAPRTPLTLAKTLVSIIPGGAEWFDDLVKSGALQKSVDWFLEEVKKLDVTWDKIKALFKRAWDEITLLDLAFPPIKAALKLQAIFAPTLSRLLDFGVAVGKKILEFIFEAVMARGGLGDMVVSTFRKGQRVFGAIVADPKKFLGYLVASVNGGFQKFSDNFVEHLKGALFEWLVGPLGSLVKLPAKLDLMGFVSVIFQILGLTYANLRAILVEKIGEPAMGYLETAFEFIKLIVTKGLAAAWDKLKEMVSGALESVVDGVVKWVAQKVVVTAVMKIVSMFNPIGALIQVILTIYDAVTFVIEKAKKILEFVNSVLDSLDKIVAGNIGGAVDFIERSLHRALVVIIEFLAQFLHVGGIPDKIRELVKGVQDKVLGGLRKLADWIFEKAKGLLAKLGVGGAKLPETSFDADGEHHRIFYKQAGARQVLTVASDEEPLEDFFKRFAGNPATAPWYADAQAAAKEVNTAEGEVEKLAPKNVKTGTVPVEDPKLPGLRKKLGDAELKLAKLVAKMIDATGVNKIDAAYETEGMVASYSSMPGVPKDKLTPDHQPQDALMLKVKAFKVIAGFDTYSHGKAWAINLYERRHALGRTFKKSVPAATLTLLESKKADLPALLHELRVVAKGDADEIVGKVKPQDVETADYWDDVRAKEPQRPKRAELAKRIAARIVKGEQKIAQQPFEW